MRVSTFQFFAVLLLVLVNSPVLLGQQTTNSEDQHVSADRALSLYRRSVFAHGYIHGYEDGFREGDIDLQTGHDARDCKHIKEFLAADRGYRHVFGSREQFRAAYRKGFASGYTDGLARRDFRAVAAARRRQLDSPTCQTRLPILRSTADSAKGTNQGR